MTSNTPDRIVICLDDKENEWFTDWRPHMGPWTPYLLSTPARENAEELLEALEVFLAHEVDYMTRNCLGDPEKQHRVIQARATIAKAREEATK